MQFDEIIKNSGLEQDFPKLESPFIREETEKGYVCTKKIDNRFRWVFTKECTAVEKLDGTNTSILVENNRLTRIMNRKNIIEPFSKQGKPFTIGILEAIEKDYFKLEGGQHFGELMGKTINGNFLELDSYIWLPFSLMLTRNKYKFWDNLEFENKSDEEIYEITSNIFKDLWSLEYRRRYGKIKPAEGIVFYRIIDNKITELCKLRRDMFDWFEGRRHT